MIKDGGYINYLGVQIGNMMYLSVMLNRIKLGILSILFESFFERNYAPFTACMQARRCRFPVIAQAVVGWGFLCRGK